MFRDRAIFFMASRKPGRDGVFRLWVNACGTADLIRGDDEDSINTHALFASSPEPEGSSSQLCGATVGDVGRDGG